jgi:hypothetical protein
MNAAFLRRLEAAELAIVQLSDVTVHHLARLALCDPATLTDAECVELWRVHAKRQIAPPPPPFAPAEREAILAEWRRLCRRSPGGLT